MTSDRGGVPTSSRRVSTTRILVIAAVVGAVAFGLYLGYLAWANDSFPAQVMPFSDYATVTSSSFNGTEFAFSVRWNNASYLPMFAQLTSPATDAANTPVCSLGYSAVEAGQVIFMPFTISPASATLSNVDLSIAVKSIATGSEFTVVYNVAGVSATNTPIVPSDVSCQQPLGSY